MTNEKLEMNGIFISNVKHLRESFSQILPAVLRGFDESYRTFDVETENA